MADRSTRVLLAVIACGIWVNVAITVMTLNAVNSQPGAPDISTIQRDLDSIASDVSDVKSNTDAVPVISSNEDTLLSVICGSGLNPNGGTVACAGH
ncbi:hypothetical protein GCM10010909_04950 [Acidocella aquatica]|uniref:Uncharacterized protein n=1 Tax=Acidocella aquatica TaxID=1922313 RepID=A0ABQ6A3C7_9PROT|nr:hypothetical protein [Acidocella aquatica]GLR65817.1 hypothetical protein GCM10010909_04950 [Acidocella aquatica]